MGGPNGSCANECTTIRDRIGNWTALSLWIQFRDENGNGSPAHRLHPPVHLGTAARVRHPDAGRWIAGHTACGARGPGGIQRDGDRPDHVFLLHRLPERIHPRARNHGPGRACAGLRRFCGHGVGRHSGARRVHTGLDMDRPQAGQRFLLCRTLCGRGELAQRTCHQPDPGQVAVGLHGGHVRRRRSGPAPAQPGGSPRLSALCADVRTDFHCGGAAAAFRHGIASSRTVGEDPDERTLPDLPPGDPGDVHGGPGHRHVFSPWGRSMPSAWVFPSPRFPGS